MENFSYDSWVWLLILVFQKPSEVKCPVGCCGRCIRHCRQDTRSYLINPVAALCERRKPVELPAKRRSRTAVTNRVRGLRDDFSDDQPTLQGQRQGRRLNLRERLYACSVNQTADIFCS